MRQVFSTAGRPIFFTAASSSFGFETGANSVVAMPSFWKSCFSLRRCGPRGLPARDRENGNADQADSPRGRACSPTDRRRGCRWSLALAFLERWRIRGGIGMGEDAAGLLGTEFSNGFPDGGVFCTKDGGGEERGVDGAGSADGERANRDAAGHLRDGEERVQALESFRFDRNAQDGENGFRSGHAGKVGGTARAGDDDFDAALFGGPRIFEEKIGGAVGGDDARFMWNMEFGERLGGKFHGVPVGAGTHDDANERIRDFPLAVGRAPLRR